MCDGPQEGLRWSQDSLRPSSWLLSTPELYCLPVQAGFFHPRGNNKSREDRRPAFSVQVRKSGERAIIGPYSHMRTWKLPWQLRDWRRRCGQGLCSCLAQNSTGEAELGQSGRRAARVLESSGARMALSKDLPMFFKGRRKEWRRTFPRSWTQHICLYHWPELGHMTIPGCKESSWIIYSGWPFAKLKWETPSLKKKVRRNIRRILAV